MGIMLPGELAGLLNELGYTWPKSDETKLFELGQMWMELADSLQQAAADGAAAAQRVLDGNQGDALAAFQQRWESGGSAISVLRDGGAGARMVAATLFVCAIIVLALKINVIVQLVILLVQIIQAIATAAPTFGASLLEIPIFKKLTDMVLGMLVDQAIGVVLG
ncbi:WXG100-like domain-containing protein [Micromonospora sp. ZYX-F-536]|uniref:WXG100-like domain-containing protein n=1 Tax=Micromonospora sp. ZYX-F-536 TaxID=3457629 RepID=UPI004040799B